MRSSAARRPLPARRPASGEPGLPARFSHAVAISSQGASLRRALS